MVLFEENLKQTADVKSHLQSVVAFIQSHKINHNVDFIIYFICSTKTELKWTVQIFFSVLNWGHTLSSLTWKCCQCWQTAFDHSFLDFTVRQKGLSVCLCVCAREIVNQSKSALNCTSRMSVLSNHAISKLSKRLSCDLKTVDVCVRLCVCIIVNQSDSVWFLFWATLSAQEDVNATATTEKVPGKWQALLSLKPFVSYPVFHTYTQTLWRMHTKLFSQSLELSLSLYRILLPSNFLSLSHYSLCVVRDYSKTMPLSLSTATTQNTYVFPHLKVSWIIPSAKWLNVKYSII